MRCVWHLIVVGATLFMASMSQGFFVRMGVCVCASVYSV